MVRELDGTRWKPVRVTESLDGDEKQVLGIFVCIWICAIRFIPCHHFLFCLRGHVSSLKLASAHTGTSWKLKEVRAPLAGTACHPWHRCTPDWLVLLPDSTRCYQPLRPHNTMSSPGLLTIFVLPHEFLLSISILSTLV